MNMSRIFFDMFVAFYGLSFVAFFSDAMHPRRATHRVALAVLFVAFTLETTFLVSRMWTEGYALVYSQYDAMLVVSWLIVLVALVVNAFHRLDLILFFANVLAFAFVAFDVFARQGRLLYTSSQSDLLVLHIAFGLISYVAFTFAFLCSFVYLIQDRFLRLKNWSRWVFRLPSLERLDTYAYRLIVLGFPFLLISIVLGVIWERITLGYFDFGDAKILATVVLWLMYGAYLILRIRSGWGGRRLLWYNMACFVGLILNFGLAGRFSFFHHAM